ncbi:MAG: TetR/AcrR family transcriptional regulator [Clostridiales bacterium]|nr:TetR/AcrR family transcriptional regulator [Clostridiales bacterium]
MDRRQRKTREGIFKAFAELLSKEHYNQITVKQIIDKADVGRATFYAHFETKDYLLKAFCEELFCHVFDCIENGEKEHKHIFHCDAPDSAFLHLLRHLKNNDNNILKLLSCPNNELFLEYFKENLKELISRQTSIISKKSEVPDAFWLHYICTVFVETVRWWIDNEMKETPEQIVEYFLAVI